MSGKGAMFAIVGSNFYCPLLNSKSPLICIVEKQQKDHNHWIAAFSQINGCYSSRCPSCLTKTALTGRLKTAKCECLRSSAHCQVRMFVKQPNRWLQQLLAVENKIILQQLKLSTLYMMFQLTLIFYPHQTGMRSEML